MHRKVIVLTEPDIAPPYDFEFQLHHYVLPPETREKSKLIEVFRTTSGHMVKVDVSSTGTIRDPALTLCIWSAERLTAQDMSEVKDKVSWHLCLREDLRPFYSMVEQDPVLQASIGHNFGAKDKASYTLFDGLIDCVCAQNTIFKRLYSMMENLAASFGDRFTLKGANYFLSPTPQALATARVDRIKACKVGYRARYIKNLAKAVSNGVVNLDRIANLPLEEAREELMKLPGVGPYTADLSLILGTRRLSILHMDLFIREALTQFYFDGKTVSDQELREFAVKRWGPYQAYAGLYLTTNTETWAKKIGREFRLKSGARY